MLSFLKDFNISDECISKIKMNNTDICIYNVFCNQNDCLKIIGLFQKLRINVIEDLLINYYSFFNSEFNKVVEHIGTLDIVNFIKEINSDFNNIVNYFTF